MQCVTPAPRRVLAFDAADQVHVVRALALEHFREAAITLKDDLDGRLSPARADLQRRAALELNFNPRYARGNARLMGAQFHVLCRLRAHADDFQPGEGVLVRGAALAE